MLPYTLDEIQRRVSPVAEKYRLRAVYLFGSYARGEATADSDIDLVVDLAGSAAHGLDFVDFYEDLTDALETKVDIVTALSIAQPTNRQGRKHFRENVNREKVQIYGQA